MRTVLSQTTRAQGQAMAIDHSPRLDKIFLTIVSRI